MKRLQPLLYKFGMQRRARAVYAHEGGVHAEGVIVAYIDAPSYVIVTDEGRTVPWRCDLTDVGERVSDEEYHHHANARRLRDGRDTVRPELREDGLPIIRTGMSVLEICERVVAHGLNPARVMVEYAGCGSHEIELSEDSRPRADIEAEIEVERLRVEAREKEQRDDAAIREAEAEAMMDDPTEGWQ